tara:strand:- start:165 stop:452 length:288 start_codon:yes stop_codon:yes gene_type:complete
MNDQAVLKEASATFRNVAEVVNSSLDELLVLLSPMQLDASAMDPAVTRDLKRMQRHLQQAKGDSKAMANNLLGAAKLADALANDIGNSSRRSGKK